MRSKLTNLLAETVAFLARQGRSPEDVDHVRYDGGWCRWPEFAAVARRIDYDNGFGAAFISPDLMVVGLDWWLNRHEYDGRENWVFNSMPRCPVGPAGTPGPDELTDDYLGSSGDVVIAPADSDEVIDLVLAPDDSKGDKGGLSWTYARSPLSGELASAWSEIADGGRDNGLSILPLRVLSRPIDPNLYKLEAEIDGVVEYVSSSVAALSGPETRAGILRNLYQKTLQAYSTAVLKRLQEGQRDRDTARRMYVPAEDVPAIKDHFDRVVRESRLSTQEYL